jgi:hypothetical protein
LLDKLLSGSQAVFTSNMRKAASLTLEILKSLYLKADLSAPSEGFVATCLEEEAIDLVQSFLATRVIEMISVDMS